MKLVLLVLDNYEKLPALLDAWKEAGVSGATVLFSTGMGRISQSVALRDDLPLMPSLDDFLPHLQHLSRTVFSVVEDDAVVEKLIAATESIVGDLDLPGRGLLIVLPVAQIRGLRKVKPDAGQPAVKPS